MAPSRRKFASIVVGVVFACGGKAASSGTGADAGPDADAGADSGPWNGVPGLGEGGPFPDAALTCSEPPYTSAPSGAACNGAHIVFDEFGSVRCVAPLSGTRCEYLSFSYSMGDNDGGTVPDGFDCGYELGFAFCHWTGSHPLDGPSLEAACAATIAFPDAIVTCGVEAP